MLDSLKSGPPPLLYPCAATGLVDAVQQAARQASETLTFDSAAVGRLRATRRPRHDFRLPPGAGGVIFLEIWADDALCRPHAIGVLYAGAHREFAIVLGKGWPGADPEILPALFSASAGGVVRFRCDDAVRASVARTAGDVMADVLRALDAVAREGGVDVAGEEDRPDLPDFAEGGWGELDVGDLA
ncbi:hypothetical protein AAC691_10330 [Nguyenibacter vanlangensis]|uniref:Uncharacterized protein n=1 Tax=Nguyenibacter vanlangensis TaxID=1216886 RepID=A0ABZ3DAI2_9PROT